MVTEQLNPTEYSEIPGEIVRDTADKFEIPGQELLDALEEIDEYVKSDAEFIKTRSVTKVSGGEDDAVIADAGHFMVLYVPPHQWDEIQVETDLSGDYLKAAKEIHTEFARRVGADEEMLATHDALLLPTPKIHQLTRAGLSRKQAEVQALRMKGATHETIGDELGIAVGTVKSHCRRIDEKIRQAKKLVQLTSE